MTLAALGVAAPFLLFVVISIWMWSTWALNTGSWWLAAWAASPVVAAGAASAVSRRRGESLRRTAAPALVGTCAVTVASWVAVFLELAV